MKTIKYFLICYILFALAFIINLLFIMANVVAVFTGKTPALSFAGQLEFCRLSFPVLIAGAVAVLWAYKVGKLDHIIE